MLIFFFYLPNLNANFIAGRESLRYSRSADISKLFYNLTIGRLTTSFRQLPDALKAVALPVINSKVVKTKGIKNNKVALQRAGALLYFRYCFFVAFSNL